MEQARATGVQVEAAPLVLLVHFGDAQFRGSERCLLNAAKGIAECGYELVLWTNHATLAAMVAPLAREILLSDFSAPIGFGAGSGKVRSVAALMGLIRQARALIRRLRPNLILCNSLAPCQWMIPASLLTGTPTLAYIHTSYRPKLRLLSFAYGASHLIGVSAYALQNFVRDGFPEGRFSIVYNGVDDLAEARKGAMANMRATLGIAENEFVIASLSALVEWKRVDLIVEAFKLASTSPGRNLTLIVVGDGPCLPRLKEAAGGARVIFCGWCDDVAAILGAADCVVSAAEQEAFALSLLEAASMGVPVIGARAGGTVEAIVDGETGLFAEPGSAASFASCMLRLRDDPELRQRLGASARQAFQERYQVRRMQRDINTLVNSYSRRERRLGEGMLARAWRLAWYSVKLSAWRVQNAWRGKPPKALT
ncbi:glycosyltransferase family 4 protein [Noviherbaspirillum pedocola]|uniref:Glycosyltransferase family 4 protein n=1 Tax=Noviherbaspirillum pedocola TaxID=2801341 RepID=A0A934T0T5_9BURK|nr:glycosyltransferase family 4 protein [Noviherbaspirillum pedocola]MBK4736727.1 glycosyltransferase family 4 protein [Noviherbaspirillum pedocola]